MGDDTERARRGAGDSPNGTAGEAAALALLAEPARRQLYELVRRAGRPMTREEAAAEAGISAKLAAFHLDKLVAGGLLQSRTQRPGGAVRLGRRPTVYEPSGREVALSAPPRQYDLLAEILLEVVETTKDGPGDTLGAAYRSAHARGHQLGAAARTRLRGPRLGPERALSAAAGLLDGCGFDPDRVAPDQVLLRNCPFHRLADRSRAVVCGMNRAFCAGILDGLGAATTVAELAPEPGLCCVRLRTRAT